MNFVIIKAKSLPFNTLSKSDTVSNTPCTRTLSEARVLEYCEILTSSAVTCISSGESCKFVNHLNITL